MRTGRGFGQRWSDAGHGVVYNALAVAPCLVLLAVGCSKDEPSDMMLIDPSQAAPSNGPTAGSPSAPDNPASGAPTAGTSGGAGSSAPIVDGPSSAGEGGDASAGPTTDGGADAMAPTADCTPSAWQDPGTVPDPMIERVADDAGTTGRPFEQTAGLEDYDYVMEEFFFSGTSPAYKTRMVVRRPRDAAKFSGTVFVEWYNVSGGIDFAVLWASSREYFMREGHVHVGVSAQAVGATALADYDAERYGALEHPGDTAADAIFSQAAMAIRSQTEALLGPCMPVDAVLAVGQSQSSARLVSYVNNTHASARIYDGFLLHSGGEPASNDPGVPVFVVMTMSEGNGQLQDGPNLVKWVIAGATHNDERITSRGAEVGEAIGMGMTFECVNPMNKFPSYRAYNAALDWLHRWVRNGDRPPAGMPFQAAGSGLALDADDNVLGGVRTMDIEVPIAMYGTDNAPTNPLDFIGLLACGLGGTTVPFTESQLLERYPTHDAYVEQYSAAADEALAAGYVLQADHDEAIEQAQAAPIPN